MSSNLAPLSGALHNKLLAALPAFDWKRVKGSLSFLETPAGKTLCELESRLDYAYFPTTSIISILQVAGDGAATEIATIGNEGLLGVSLFMGGETPANRGVVQNNGGVYRLKRKILQDEFSRGGAMQHLLLRYTHALLTQISQTAACNRHHSIVQQMCRWLLLSLDRLASEELTMTHEALANTLGVRREGISEAAISCKVPASSATGVVVSRLSIVAASRLVVARATAWCAAAANMIACRTPMRCAQRCSTNRQPTLALAELN
jgi:hypothetical protein